MTLAQEGWTAIVLAGQRPGPDPLATAFGTEYKALVEIGGMPMVRHVVDTLLDCRSIAKIVVLAQDLAAIGRVLPHDARIVVSESGDGISASINRIAGTAIAPWPVFVTTADHPLLTREMIEHFLSGTGNADLSVGMVERRVMSAAYPDNKRTWLKFADGHWSGANLFALRTSATRTALDLWAGAEKDRKTVWKLFLHFGPWLAVRALTRTIGLADALARAGRRLGMVARLVPMPQAEAAIDVDKPSDFIQAEAILASRIKPVA